MLATSTAGLLPSARLLLPRAIHETGAGTWNGPPCDANGAPRMSRGHAQPEEPGGKLEAARSTATENLAATSAIGRLERPRRRPGGFRPYSLEIVG